MVRMWRLLVLAAAALLLPACRATGYYGLWQPKPLELTVREADGAPAALFSAAVLGRWHGEPDDGEIHVRLRVENLGRVPLRVPLERVQLLSGDLQPCGAPRLVGGQPGDVAPGGIGSVDVGFMPPAEDPDLRGLQLRWVLELDGHELPGSATFQRADPIYPPYYPAVHFGVGWGYSSGCAWDGWCSTPTSAPVQALPPHVTSLPPKP
jgi:hypothetical protein